MGSLIIPCPSCDTANRVQCDKPLAEAKCGRCGKPLLQGRPITLTSANFERHATSDLPLLVDFWASWCGPCRQMGPIFEAAAARLEPSMRLGKVDTQADPTLASRFSIRSIPALILLHKGTELSRRAGTMSLEALCQWASRAAIAWPR